MNGSITFNLSGSRESVFSDLLGSSQGAGVPGHLMSKQEITN